MVTWEDKFHRTASEPEKVCPAAVSDALAAKLREISIAAFQACHCKDYARIDIRIDAEGNPYVLEINSMAALGANTSYVTAAKAAGLGFAQLVNRIVDVAYARYFAEPAPITRPSATNYPVVA